MAKQTETIDAATAAGLIRATRDGPRPVAFNVRFIKRSDGTERTMTAFLGTKVKVGLKGGKAAYDFNAKGLITAYEIPPGVSKEECPRADRRKCIPIDGIRELTIHGKTYKVG